MALYRGKGYTVLELTGSGLDDALYMRDAIFALLQVADREMLQQQDHHYALELLKAFQPAEEHLVLPSDEC